MFDSEKRLLQNISHSHSYSDGFNGRLRKYRALKIKELYSGGGSLLDIGASDGLLTQLIAGSFKKIVVVEASSFYLEKAKINLKEYPVYFYHGLFEDFNTNECFDMVLASGVLEHVRDPLLILNKIRNLLTDEGFLIVIVPNAKSLHRQIGVKMGIIQDCYQLQEHDFKVGHRRYYDLEKLMQDVIRAGFKIINSGGILLKVLPNKDMENLSEDFCDALYEIGNIYPNICAEVYLSCKK